MGGKGDKMKVRLPKRFLSDHIDRDLLRVNGESVGLEAVLVKELKNHYIVELTQEQFDELLSDANYYRDGGGGGAGGMDWAEYGWLISSAKATYNALVKQKGNG